MKRFLISVFFLFLISFIGCYNIQPLLIDYDTMSASGGLSCSDLSTNKGVLLVNNTTTNIHIKIYQSYSGSLGGIIRNMPPGESFLFLVPYLANGSINVVVVVNNIRNNIVKTRSFYFYGSRPKIYVYEIR
jgi:hypothetical protein